VKKILIAGLVLAGVSVVALGSGKKRSTSPRDGKSKAPGPIDVQAMQQAIAAMPKERIAALPTGVDYQAYLSKGFDPNVWNAQQAEYLKRYEGLGKPTNKDDPRYTLLYYTGPWVYVPTKGMVGPGVKVNGKYVVELNYYGQGPKSEGGGVNFLDIIGNVGNLTLPWIPGYGTAANAALQGAVALGKGKSLKDAGLAAARGALPPYGQIAFDMGVGIASGKSVDSSAKEAALTYLETKYPGARAAYNKGKALVS
jgi:hypothetical protein